MGNRLVVEASSGAVPLPPPPLPPSPVAAGSAKNSATALSSASPPSGTLQPPAPPRFSLNNPGSFEDLHKRAKDVFPSNFEGFRFMLNKPLSNHFQVSHTVNVGMMQSGYRFGATYIGHKVLSPSEAYPVMLGEIEANGNLNAQIIHMFGTRLRSRLIAQYDEGKLAGLQLSNDYRARDFTASLTLGQLDIVRASGIVVGQYLQSVTKALALGAELMYQKGTQIPGGHISILSLGAKYTGSDFQVGASLGLAGVHLSYHQRCSEQLQVGVDWDTSLRSGESVASLGYAVEIPKANATFRGSVDTNGSVGAILERRLFPLPATLALSALINHKKAASQFGIGLMIGG
ncbi:mitochondrial import receptor subunit TOM40 homolog [Paramacrobiotus metropolitanus]|uniref:mitochondrial import receptor subunit TOM40 homolog n=1 Tax=Paramacrobiotus metropolitanus TaxID=2943436 RepID=UPI0024460EFF|nr:mitochondrial import receptor subunit TOM40 homolog [Paramacrobiotus metropolitanus]